MHMKKEGDMMRSRLLVIGIVLLLVSGCTATQVVTPPPAPHVQVLREDMGWVQVKVTGVSAPGYTLAWGDGTSAYSVSAVIPHQSDYEHMYQSPGKYTITVLTRNGAAIADTSVQIFSVDCHVSLIAVNGRTITVRYFGRYGIDYTLAWGDRYSTAITATTGTGVLSHTYSAPGAYAVSMGETWAPPRTFFTVTIDR